MEGGAEGEGLSAVSGSIPWPVRTSHVFLLLLPIYLAVTGGLRQLSKNVQFSNESTRTRTKAVFFFGLASRLRVAAAAE